MEELKKVEEKKEMSGFQKLRAMDIKKYIVNKKINGKDMSYLTWSKAWHCVKVLDPIANYEFHENEKGNAFFESKYGIDCKTSVTIFNLTHTMRLPVLDGANNAMKDEKYEYEVDEYVYGKKTGNKVSKPVAAADMTDINKTQMRCFVKAIAMHGLGLDLYMGEDLPFEIDGETVVIISVNDETKPEIIWAVQSTDAPDGKTTKYKDALKDAGFKYNFDVGFYTLTTREENPLKDINIGQCEVGTFTKEEWNEHLPAMKKAFEPARKRMEEARKAS